MRAGARTDKGRAESWVSPATPAPVGNIRFDNLIGPCSLGSKVKLVGEAGVGRGLSEERWWWWVGIRWGMSKKCKRAWSYWKAVLYGRELSCFLKTPSGYALSISHAHARTHARTYTHTHTRARARALIHTHTHTYTDTHKYTNRKPEEQNRWQSTNSIKDNNYNSSGLLALTVRDTNYTQPLYGLFLTIWLLLLFCFVVIGCCCFVLVWFGFLSPETSDSGQHVATPRTTILWHNGVQFSGRLKTETNFPSGRENMDETDRKRIVWCPWDALCQWMSGEKGKRKHSYVPSLSILLTSKHAFKPRKRVLPPAPPSAAPVQPSPTHPKGQRLHLLPICHCCSPRWLSET